MELSRFDSAPLSALCTAILDCNHSTPVWTDQGYVVLRSNNIKNGKLDISDPSYTNQENYLLRTRREVPMPNDLVITREAPMGEVCMIPDGLRCCLGQRMVLLKPNLTKVVPDYLLFAIQSTAVQDAIRVQGGTGSTVSNLRIPVLASLEISLPHSRTEQEAIAEALSDADALIESLEQLLVKKRQIKQGTMQELLTGKRRLPGFTSKWEVKSLGDVLDKVVGGGTPSRANPNYWGKEIPWATVKDFATFDSTETQESITYEGLKESSTNLIPKGTLITSTRMGLGKAVIYEVDVSINQDLKALFPKRLVDSKFLYFWFDFHAQEIQNLGSGSTVMGISLVELKAIKFPLAEVLEQTAIATILSDMDADIAALQAKLAKARHIKQGMMQQLLTGQIRLV